MGHLPILLLYSTSFKVKIQAPFASGGQNPFSLQVIGAGERCRVGKQKKSKLLL
jgi:hypothetical protein